MTSSSEHSAVNENSDVDHYFRFDDRHFWLVRDPEGSAIFWDNGYRARTESTATDAFGFDGATYTRGPKHSVDVDGTKYAIARGEPSYVEAGVIPEADVKDFYQAYGEAMSACGGIEMSLAAIFVSLMQADDPQRARSVYHSGIGFQAQLEMIECLIRTAFSDEISAVATRWKTLRTKIKKAQANRNLIAHMHVWRMTGHALYGQSPKKAYILLPIAWEERKEHVVTTASLTRIAQQASLLARDLQYIEDECRKAFPTRHVRREAK